MVTLRQGNLVQAYLRYPTKVSTSLEFRQLPFPAVTVCNINPVTASKLPLVSDFIQREALAAQP